jgi:beta-lactamase regulating signal transducer with metallopeptidase domain
MIWILAFSLIAALLVWLAGRRDEGRDPRLSILLLALLVLFPLLRMWMPKLVSLPAAPADAASGWPWGALVFLVWAAGFLIAAGRPALGLLELNRWRARSIRLRRINRVEVRELHGLRSPVAAGIFRPVVFVPPAWHVWSADLRGFVMEHELEHHRRRDPLWRLLAEIACALHWYHPLVRWMSRRLAVQCEFACDAAVLHKGVDAKTYARVLCDLADDRSTPAPALAMASASMLESRIVRMTRRGGFAGTGALVLLACAGLGAACALSMIGRGNGGSRPISAGEVDLRWSADPFPGE